MRSRVNSRVLPQKRHHCPVDRTLLRAWDVHDAHRPPNSTTPTSLQWGHLSLVRVTGTFEH